MSEMKENIVELLRHCESLDKIEFSNGLLEVGRQTLGEFSLADRYAKQSVTLNLERTREALLEEKVRVFLSVVSSVPFSIRQNAFSSVDFDDAKTDRIGSNLFLLLDRLNVVGKAELVGRCWVGLINGVISLSRTERLCDVLSRVDIHLIDAVRDLMEIAETPRVLSRVDPSWLTSTIRFSLTSSSDSVVKSEADWEVLTHLARCELLGEVYRGGGSMGPGGGYVVNQMTRDAFSFVLDS